MIYPRKMFLIFFQIRTVSKKKKKKLVSIIMPRVYMCNILEISRLIAQCLQFLGFAVRMCRECELIKSMESLSGLNNKRTRS